MKLFLNPEVSAHLRGLSSEFAESSNAIRVELNRMTEAGLLVRAREGRTVAYKANQQHKLFPDIRSIILKYAGFDQIVEGIVHQLGQVDFACVTGDYAQGIDSGLIDLVIVGCIDDSILRGLVKRSEEVIDRKIRTLIIAPEDLASMRNWLEGEHPLVLWTRG